jgi:hypothetical protein
MSSRVILPVQDTPRAGASALRAFWKRNVRHEIGAARALLAIFGESPPAGRP